ncbi:MAG: hypothetical protein J6386_16825 [Candidatus Synoicihabitans palmerolidicus]|nr:hypothetical protein [Candidatus Synoicihabitans palmerolidicus]
MIPLLVGLLWKKPLSADGVLAHELHTGGTLRWPLFLLIRPQSFNWVTRVVGAWLLLVVGQSYEPLGISMGVVALISFEAIRRLPAPS